MYEFNESALENEYRGYFGKEEMPETVKELIRSCSALVISAYYSGKRGESLTVLCPWIKEVKVK